MHSSDAAAADDAAVRQTLESTLCTLPVHAVQSRPTGTMHPRVKPARRGLCVSTCTLHGCKYVRTASSCVPHLRSIALSPLQRSPQVERNLNTAFHARMRWSAPQAAGQGTLRLITPARVHCATGPMHVPHACRQPSYAYPDETPLWAADNCDCGRAPALAGATPRGVQVDQWPGAHAVVLPTCMVSSHTGLRAEPRLAAATRCAAPVDASLAL